jgi:hypothetical protein
VPRSVSPFANPIHEAMFCQSLLQIQMANAIPDGFGVLSNEWDAGGYPTFESIAVGRCAKKITIELPQLVWLPRAIAWAQGLHTMQTFLYQSEQVG